MRGDGFNYGEMATDVSKSCPSLSWSNPICSLYPSAHAVTLYDEHSTTNLPECEMYRYVVRRWAGTRIGSPEVAGSVRSFVSSVENALTTRCFA
jgi:hypothetical protein